MLPFRNKFGYFLRRNMYRVANLDWFDGMKYKSYTGKKLNLKDPQTWSEKLLWLNRYWQPELKSICADKYRVREYVQQKGLADILVPMIGHWNTPDEIDFNSLPNRFALKCNHGCGSNIICEDKSTLDIAEAKRKLNIWLKVDYSTRHNEKHYKNIKPCIVGEEFLPVKSLSEIIDYKIHCFDGVPMFIAANFDRDPITLHSHAMVFSPKWERIKCLIEEENIDEMKRPQNLEELVETARILSEGMPYVRVDLYSINDKLYFGELTFTPSGNMIMVDYTLEFDAKMGKYIDLTKIKNN